MTMSNDWDYLYGVGNWRSRLITLKQSNRWKFLSSCNTLAPLSSRNNNLSCTKPSAQRRLHSWLIYTFPLQSCNFQTNLNKFLDWSHKSFDDLCYNNNRQKDFKPAELIWWLHTMYKKFLQELKKFYIWRLVSSGQEHWSLVYCTRFSTKAGRVFASRSAG